MVGCIIAFMTRTFTLEPQGAFSLRESVEFGFGQRHSERFDGVMRLAFCLDGTFEGVGVEVRQDDGAPGLVHCTVHGNGDLDAVRRQVARVLSLDHDGHAFDEIGRRDPVIGRLQQVAPGLRPPLFHSPYEAAIWSVLSARRPAMQMARVRAALAQAQGVTFELAGRALSSLPGPAQILELDEFAGIPADKLTRMQGIARATLGGQLDVDRLVALGPAAATLDVQKLSGIGPFYASLIVIRATGFADVLPLNEPTILGLITEMYSLGHPCTAADFERIGEQWRPLRTWASVLVRAGSSRL